MGKPGAGENFRTISPDHGGPEVNQIGNQIISPGGAARAHGVECPGLSGFRHRRRGELHAPAVFFGRCSDIAEQSVRSELSEGCGFFRSRHHGRGHSGCQKHIGRDFLYDVICDALHERSLGADPREGRRHCLWGNRLNR